MWFPLYDHNPSSICSFDMSFTCHMIRYIKVIICMSSTCVYSVSQGLERDQICHTIIL